MSSAPNTRRLFLSHAWGDKTDPDHLAVTNFLKAVGIEGGVKTPGWVRVPKSFLTSQGQEIVLEVFFDERSIASLADMTESLELYLGQSHLLAACWSTRYPTRAACMWEYKRAFFSEMGTHLPGRRVKVLPVHLSSVIDTLRPRIDVQDRLLPDLRELKSEGARLEVWQALAEAAAAFETPMGVPSEDNSYGFGGGSVDYKGFVGRDEELWRLFDALHTPGNAGGANVTGTGKSARPGRQGMVRGLGGIGKTLLARIYSQLFSGAYPGGIYWLEALGHNDAGANISGDDRHAERRRQLRGVANILELDLKNMADEATLRARIREALKDRGPYLWVVDDYPTRPATGETIEQWLAPSSNGASLVTSRSRVALQMGTEIALGVLAPEAAYTLLTREMAPSGEAEIGAARAIGESLGHHPLALAVTSARMQFVFSDTPYQTLLEDLEAANKVQILHEYADPSLVSQLPEGHEGSILYTLKRSVDLLSEGGQRLLQAASVLAPSAIPIALMAAILEEEGIDAGKAAMETAKAGLLQMGEVQAAPEQRGTRTLEVHTLVAHTAAVAMTPEARSALRGVARGAVLVAMRGAQDSRKYRALAPWSIHGHALVDESEAGLKLLGWLGRHAYEGGDYGSARINFEKQWDGLVRVLGEEHPATLNGRNNLAEALRAQGDLMEARQHQEAVLEAEARVLGEEHPSTLNTRNNLAATLYAQGNLLEAREHGEAALEAQARVLGEEHPDTLNTRNNLAETLRAQGDLSGARGHQEVVLEAQARVLGEQHPDTLNTRNNLAGTLYTQGDLEGARGHQEAVFEAKARLLGEEHPSTLTTRNNLAGTLHAQGNLLGAREHYEVVLERQTRVLGEEHPHTLITRNNLATTLKALQDIDQS